ncbi:MAG: hypothetical protein HYX80_09090 [Chloroflexi bacterium]|nr:hypothetical protein [Chloroflexota bacterium]
MGIGLILVAVGVLWLLTKLGILSGSIWNYFWPVVLIIIGLSFIWGWRSRRKWVQRWWPPDEDQRH